MNEIEILGTYGKGMELLDGELNAASDKEFAEQFRSVCSCPTAKTLRGVVYIWFTEGPIPRLKGNSPIVYIGKTNMTIKDRHFPHADLEASDTNWRKYDYIIKQYGPIRIACKQVKNPREAERHFLLEYLMVHLELPPINASL
jgi:hypothetical protein